MKKTLFLVGGACAASLLMAGCAGVAVSGGAPQPIAMGMNIYSQVSANAMIQPVAGTDYTVIKRDVKSSAKLTSYFTAINLGDISYETLKADALKNVPGAQDLIDVKMDYSMNNICGINSITVNLTATAIKYNK